MRDFMHRQSGVDLNELHEQFSAIAQILVVDPTTFSVEPAAESDVLAAVSQAAELVARLPALVRANSSSSLLRWQVDALASVAGRLASIVVADRGNRVILSSCETCETARLASEMVSVATRIILVLARITDTRSRRRYVVVATLRTAWECTVHAISAFLAANSGHLPLLSSHRCVVAVAVIRLIVSIWARRVDLLRSTRNRAPRNQTRTTRTNGRLPCRIRQVIGSSWSALLTAARRGCAGR
jgi:hypothetical protein